ncbi:MAG: alpha/beta fold hydrolase [Paenibacillaceae bacterium]|nr:alpha/beta fold hydrolase [Paenibacillaceae bacterium]
MTAVERRLAELRAFQAPLTAQPDLEAFWERTLAESAARTLDGERTLTATPLAHARVYRVAYRGFDETPIHGWYMLPAFPAAGDGAKLPCVVLFHGYHGDSGYPEQHASWLLMGFAVFAIDIRGQAGETGNLLPQTHGMTRGWVSQNILDPYSCYYRAITVDCVRAVDWAAEQPEVDPSRIAVVGGSQGGGLSLITAALSDKPVAAIATVPNMCHMDFGIMNSTGSLSELAGFVSRFPDKLGDVLRTLSYFDNMNLAHRITIPIFVSACLKDTVCQPEMVCAAFNRIASSEKRLDLYPFDGHYVSPFHHRESLDFLIRALRGQTAG